MAGSAEKNIALSEELDLDLVTQDINDKEMEASEVEDKEGSDSINTGNHTTEPQEKLIKLPLSRIKAIIKTDPDVKLASQEAVITLAKAAELFIQSLAKEAAVRTLRDKRKTVLRKHLDSVFDTKDSFAFLEGVLESFES